MLGSPLSFVAWRSLASENAGSAVLLPRLVGAELFFARSHAANARAHWLGGVPRLWALANILRRLESRFSHLDFDADDLDALRAMAASLSQMRRQNLAALPVGDDAFGRELDEWRVAYDAHLEAENAFDFEAAPALFAHSVKSNRAFAFPQTLVVDNLPELSPTLEQGLSALIARATTVCATLALPNGWNDPVATRAHAFWTTQGAHFVTLETQVPALRLRVARALLSERSEATELPPAVSLWQAHTPWDEWERIAAHIRGRLEDGAGVRDFCLVLPDPSAQVPLMRAAFEANGVPLAWRERETDSSPLVERLLRLLIPRPAWNVDALHDLLGDGALRLEWTTEEGELLRFDAGRLRRAHRSIRGESDEAAWRNPPALASDWEARIKRLRDAASGRGDEARANLLARSLDGGDLEGIARLKALFAPLQEPLSAHEWAQTTLSIFDTLCAHWQEENDIAGRACAAIKRVRAGVEALATRAGEDGAPRTSNRWVAWLRLELVGTALDEYADDTPSAGVRVLRASDAGEAGSEGECEIFVAGLSERAWPARPPQSPWPVATSKVLERLREGEPAPLPRALHGLARLMATSATLSLSHPAWLDGNESEASPLVEDLRALFPISEWPELPRAESQPRTYSRSQWLRRQSASTFSGVEDDELALRLNALDTIRRQRSDASGFGHYDGVLGERGHDLLKPLLPRDEGRLELSASGAELYARCGLRYFFERVLELGDETRAEDDLSRAESGDLVHRILHLFRREWSEPLSDATFESARAALEEHTRRECERLGLPPILRRAEARRLLGTPRRDGTLVRLLRAECREADGGTNTTFVETFHPLVHLQRGCIEGPADFDWRLAIGGNGLEQSFRLPLDGAVVKGRIDRVDASPDAQWLLVLDYKTGNAASLPSFAKGSDRLNFQLAVYVLAARHLAAAWPTMPRVATAYLSPKSGFAGIIAAPDLLSPSTRGAMPESTQIQWLADTQNQLERIAGLIENGTFNLSLRPAKTARCEWCAQSSICGQNASIQTARAEVQLGSNVVFFPEPIEWEPRS
ncbi:ATP-dependent helicase/deoxyribonuclease subunit B [Abditibacteriota bacterium]|nr:ATP-dependent helicase/deoxyribonuclease subunit B [Abditibacteriota bacterium]